MLDFGSAVLLSGLLFMLVQLVKKATLKKDGTPALTGWMVIATTIALALVVTFVVRGSDFASRQIIDGKSLDQLNIFSCVIVALILAGLSVLGATALGVAQSIGQNNDKPV